MTGGGVVGTGNKKVTTGGATSHGFELHCRAADLPNSLEINWAKNNFHLQQLVSATCSNDGMSPQPPPAGFDVHEGTGSGVCNGLAATAKWRFTDHGEPGRNDTAEIHITGSCTLDVSGNLTSGDNQAHAQ